MGMGRWDISKTRAWHQTHSWIGDQSSACGILFPCDVSSMLLTQKLFALLTINTSDLVRSERHCRVTSHVFIKLKRKAFSLRHTIISSIFREVESQSYLAVSFVGFLCITACPRLPDHGMYPPGHALGLQTRGRNLTTSTVIDRVDVV